MEKFFRYNLCDFFTDTLSNVEEDLFGKRIKNKQIKQLASQTFLTKAQLPLSEFTSKVNEFYSSRSKCA